MLKDRICKYCGKLFKNIEGRIFSNHVRWCDKNPKDRTKEFKLKNEKIKEAYKRNPIKRKKEELKTFKVICIKCGKEFEVQEKESKFPQKEKYFCSRKCANSHIITDETKLKTSISISKIREHICPKCGSKFMAKGTNLNTLCENCKKEWNIIKICKWCGKKFQNKKYSKSSCCCSSHSQKYATTLKYEKLINLAKNDLLKLQLKLKLYRQQCAFTFSLNQYPEEFDFELIKKYGWYKAKNHGDNPNGISRDHMYSVKDGFLNNVDPKIISHPANCKLVFQKENASKKDKSSISLSELIERINAWTKKYNLNEVSN